MRLFIHAWRNMWRNPRRTLITLTAVGLNIAILIAAFSLMDGLLRHAVSNAVNLTTGEVQVHAPEYLSRRSIYDTLQHPDRLLERIRGPQVQALARSFGFGLAAHGSKSSGAQFWGINPDEERRIFDLASHMAAGSFLSTPSDGGIVLGSKLARSLELSPGDELVVVVQAADGSLGNQLFTVRGVLKSAGDSIDRTGAFIHRDDFASLFAARGMVHEIAVNSHSSLPLQALEDRVEAAAPGLQVSTWRELMPVLSDMMNIFDVSMWLFGVIFFLAAGLGVMNTMLMATFERVREFGLIKALGASPWRIVRDVAAEALVLGMTATLLGGSLGLAAGLYLQTVGLDTSAFAGSYTIAGVAFDPVWRAVVSLESVLVPILAMWGICLLASLYPAVIAARLDPVRAMQHV